MALSLHNRSLPSLKHFTPEEIRFLLDLSVQLKAEKANQTEQQRLKDKNIVLIFEKPSTRTRCAFEIAAHDQGAHITHLGIADTHIGYKESIKDTARILGRYYDAIECRCNYQTTIETLITHSNVPVWNGLTDRYHPTQALADLLTVKECFDGDLSAVKWCFLGDGNANVVRSLMIASSKMGMDFRIAAPKLCQPDANFLKTCCAIASENGGRITVTDNIADAVNNCDFVYTDVWVSMGEPDEIWKKRIELLLPYQVNKKVMQLTGKSQTKFMHCLPAFHDRDTTKGEEIFQNYGLEALEVSDDVFESDQSVVFQQAENRIHTIKAVMVATLGHL